MIPVCSCEALPTSSAIAREVLHPVPGDQIVGFVTRGSGVSVHRADCVNVKALSSGDEPDRFVEVSWAPTTKSVFRVQIQVEALDRSGLLSDVTRVLSEHHVNILSATVSTTDERLALSRFVFEMGVPSTSIGCSTLYSASMPCTTCTASPHPEFDFFQRCLGCVGPAHDGA